MPVQTKLQSQYTREMLKDLQILPLRYKIIMTQGKIQEWVEEYGETGVYVSFSGGKDSTVLLDIARRMYPGIPAVFSDTGLEYPEIRDFVKSFDGIDFVYPERTTRPHSRTYRRTHFLETVTTEGYPLISKEISQAVRKARSTPDGRVAAKFYSDSKRYDKAKYEPLLHVPFLISEKCCDVSKKNPFRNYERKTGRTMITAEMAYESELREAQWLKNGCNAFESERPKSTPMAFWTEQDILLHIKENNLPIASVYGSVEYAEQPEQARLSDYARESIVPASERLRCTGCQRTGCVFCAFGAHLEKGENRFQRLRRTHPALYEYCIGGGEWNGKMWQPSKKGLGMAYVFDTLNDIYGKDFLPY